MKKTLLVMVLIILISVLTGYSQTTETNSQSRIGIGMTITDVKDLLYSIMDLGSLTPTFFVPIQFSPNFRIEPEVGLFKYSQERDEENSKSETSANIFQLGVGICPMVHYNNFDLYYGARAGYLKVTSTDEYTTSNYTQKSEETGSGYYIAPVLGGEYYFSKLFSVGGEVQIKYTNMKIETENNLDKIEETSSSFVTKSLVFLRIYFP